MYNIDRMYNIDLIAMKEMELCTDPECFARGGPALQHFFYERIH